MFFVDVLIIFLYALLLCCCCCCCFLTLTDPLRIQPWSQDRHCFNATASSVRFVALLCIAVLYRSAMIMLVVALRCRVQYIVLYHDGHDF